MYEAIIAEFKRNAYHSCNFSMPHTTILWSVTYDKGTPHQSVVVVVDALRRKCSDTTDLEVIRDYAISQYDGISKEDVLIVSVGPLLHAFITKKNLIQISTNRNRLVASSCTKEVMASKKIVKNLFRDQVISHIHTETYSTQNVRNHATWFTFVLVALLILTFKEYCNTPEVVGISSYTLLQKREYMRLISYLFCHSNIMHLAGNCISLLAIGWMYEKMKGGISEAIIFFAGGIIAGIASASLATYTGNSIYCLTVGASGAIYALIGAYTVAACENNRSNAFSCVKYIVAVLCFQLLGNYLGHTNTDFICHIGGLISGIILQKILSNLQEVIYAKIYVKTQSKEIAALFK